MTVAAPSEDGVRDGLAYVLYAPDEPPLGGVVILHGAGSAKESHLDFARRCRAAGLAALAYDMRGHGASGGRLDGRAATDVATMAAVVRERVGPALPIGLRGSSMGGYLALVAAAEAEAAAVVAICPAAADGLRRGLREQRFSFAADEPALDAMLAAHDERAAAVRLGPALLLLHAEGDEVVPIERSRALHAAAPDSRLLALPGGHHRSIQHDAELQGETVRFLAKRLAGPR